MLCQWCVCLKVLDKHGEWVEVLGGGLLLPEVVANALGDTKVRGQGAACAEDSIEAELPTVWAMGIGLDRLAMVACGIDDIRILVQAHHELLQQFQDGHLRQVESFCILAPVSGFCCKSTRKFRV